MSLLDQNLTTKPATCVQVYRYRVSHYMRGKSIVRSVEWAPMRSLSCHGECGNARCYGPSVDAEEGGPDVDIRCAAPTDGALYVARIVASSHDPETGFCDDWYFQMEPYVPAPAAQQEREES